MPIRVRSAFPISLVLVGATILVPSGVTNNTNGTGSFAAGSGASALHSGTFVWSDDSSASALTSSGPNQFLARASGGLYLYSNAAATAQLTTDVTTLRNQSANLRSRIADLRLKVSALSRNGLPAR